MPTPTPTDEQIEAVREIAALSSFAITETKVSALNDAAWAATLDDIDEWQAVKPKHTRLTGKVEIDPDDRRAAIRARLRVRLGLTEYADQLLADVGSRSVTVSGAW